MVILMGKTYKKEQIPYQDLTQLELEHDIVLELYTPKNPPELLNKTAWKLECKYCGSTRSASGRLLLTQEHKNCKCRTQEKLAAREAPDGGREIGLGAIYLMTNEPDKFSEYLKRRDEESRRSNCSRFNHLNSKKDK